ncbi:MAG: Gfo/Idh/MocA family protein [Pseudomonadota bacterium]
MQYQALLIGCGMIGSGFADDPRVKGVYSHAGAYAAHPQTRLTAVCDASAERAEACAARWGVTHRGNDPLRMLREYPSDIVSICTPDDTHAALIDAALDTPCVRAILAEKPLATDLEQARALARKAATRDIPVALNYIRRHSPRHQALRARIADGELGEILAVQGIYTKGTLHNGSHWFDLARFLFGEVREVQAWDSLREGGADPTLDVRLLFERGFPAFLKALPANRYSIFEMDILGSAGRVRLVDSGNRIEWYAAAPSPHYSGYTVLQATAVEEEDLSNGTLHALEDLIHALEGSQAPLASAEDGVAAIEIGMAARESILTGHAVALPLQ